MVESSSHSVRIDFVDSRGPQSSVLVVVGRVQERA